MNRILIAAALGATSSWCAAQTNVTLYGVVDVGITHVTGVRGGSVNQLISGMMDGSRLGVRVSEDLGDGYRAIATLESRLEADTGLLGNRPISGSQLPDRLSTPAGLGLPDALRDVVTAVSAGLGNSVGVNLNNAFWDRQIFVGLVTPVGALLAGRQYTPGYEVTATFDTLGTQSSLSAGQAASIPASVDIRLSNALAYRIQLGGFSAAAMVAAGEGSATSGRFGGVMAMYKSPAFSVGVGHNTRENERGDKSLTSTIVGASAAIGPGSVSGFYADVKDDNPSGLSGIAAQVAPLIGPTFAAAVQNAYVAALRQDLRIYHLGYKASFGLHTVYTAYTKADDQRAVNADTTSYGVAYTYTLSKRSDVNVALTRFDNSPTAQAAPGAAGYLGGVTTRAGTDSTSFGLGLRHRF